MVARALSPDRLGPARLARSLWCASRRPEDPAMAIARWAWAMGRGRGSNMDNGTATLRRKGALQRVRLIWQQPACRPHPSTLPS